MNQTNQLLHKTLPLSLISKYRAELMGFAILGVMCGHLMNDTIQPLFLAQFFRLIHTHGFIFLSGFGLYYSFHAHCDIRPFYYRRFTRLLIPFFLIMGPFFTALLITNHCCFIDYIANLTTAYFWFKGNPYAMWYISVSVALYLIFPFLYKFMFHNNSKPVIRFSFVMAMILGLICLIKYTAPSYWEMNNIGLSRLLSFPMGMFIGYLALQDKKITLAQSILFFTLCIPFAIGTKLWDDEFYSFARTVFGLPFICIIIHWISQYQLSHKFILQPLAWLGKYSLELYLIHVAIYYTLKIYAHTSPTISMCIGVGVALIFCAPIHKAINQLHTKIQNK